MTNEVKDKPIRTSREALVAVLLEDIGEVLTRVETLTDSIDAKSERFEKAAQALDAASTNYEKTITEFNKQAKDEITGFLERKAADAASKALIELRATMLQTANETFSNEVLVNAQRIAVVLSEAAKEYRQSRVSRMMETAIISCSCAGVVVLGLHLLK